MAWGAVSVLAGAALLASMVTFDVREIGWNYLNKSGEVMEGTTNLLNVVGLYGAGIVYWVLGGMAWMLVILLAWWGCYRFTHRGRLTRGVIYGGVFLLVSGCLFLTARPCYGAEGVERHQVLGAGRLSATFSERIFWFLGWVVRHSGRFPGWDISLP